MKTQIFNLINGNKNVVRMESCIKYSTAKKATSHDGYAGTNREERAAVAAKVFAENGEEMKVTIRNVELTLHRGSSTTGKTSWYSCELTSDEYQCITAGRTYEWPADIKFKSFSLQLNQDCTITATRYGKKSEGAEWKAREWMDIDEAFCMIMKD